MGHRLSVRITDELAEGIEARAQRTGKTKSQVVREGLSAAGLRAPRRRSRTEIAELLKEAAELRAGQAPTVSVAELIREARSDSLRLRLRRLTVPFMQADLA
jgi:Arc/MetJ-type ribon-helix-helix transcriptional regulator